MIEISYAVEGSTDVPIVEKVLVAAGAKPVQTLIARGKGKLDQRIAVWNKSSNQLPMFVLRDWDPNDGAACAPALRSRLLGNSLSARAHAFELRIAVRATESWLLADAEACAAYFGIPMQTLTPDELRDPKGQLAQACARSKKKRFRDGMTPVPGSGRRVGPEYEALVAEFGRDVWSVARAVTRSPSLARALTRATELVTRTVGR